VGDGGDVDMRQDGLYTLTLALRLS
jgi:hypothetical protein